MMQSYGRDEWRVGKRALLLGGRVLTPVSMVL